MPARIYIVHRIIRAVRIQVQRSRIFSISSICILRQESSIIRVIVSCIEVIQSSTLIPDSSGVGDFIVELRINRSLTEVTVLVRCLAISVSTQNAGGAAAHILVIEVICLGTFLIPLAGNNISRLAQNIHCLYGFTAIGMNHAAALIAISSGHVIFRLADPLTFTIISVFLIQGCGTILGKHCHIQAVICIVAVGLCQSVAASLLNQIPVGIVGIAPGAAGQHLIQPVIGICRCPAVFRLTETVSCLIISVGSLSLHTAACIVSYCSICKPP